MHRVPNSPERLGRRFLSRGVVLSDPKVLFSHWSWLVEWRAIGLGGLELVELGRGVDGARDDWEFCWFVELGRFGGGEGLEYLGLRRAVTGVTWVDSCGC